MATLERPRVLEPVGAAWPPAPGTPVVVLAKAVSSFERRLLHSYADSIGAPVHSDAADAVHEAEANDATIVPVRVGWLTEADSRAPGEARLRSTLARGMKSATAGSLRRRGQARLVGHDPARARILVGNPATVNELKARWSERELAPAPDRSEAEFAAFVDRQADIVLEMAERRLHGDRFRAPRAVVAEILNNREFVSRAEALAVKLGRSPQGVLADCRVYLEEMAADEKRWVLDYWATYCRALHSRAYDLDIDPAQLAQLRELSERHALMFLPSHKSNLDPYLMFTVTYENGLPVNHVLGGINMMFWPLGPAAKRIGVVGIRRSFRDNPVYPFMLGRYVNFLVSKRFNLEFYVEGGRSRQGKLLPPKMGLLHYLADAVEEHDLRDVLIIPTAIVYDVLHEAGEMTVESHGATKKAESVFWLLHFARQQRQRHLGQVHVRFGEPINVHEALRQYALPKDDVAPADARAVKRLARSKLAFELCTRINRATMVTAPALVTFTLLGVGDRALTLPEVRAVLEPVVGLLNSSGALISTATRELTTEAGVARTLSTLVDENVVERYDGGAEPVYRIGPEQELVAAFYRNATVHVFVNRAILELAFLKVEQTGGGMVGAWREALRLRDLLKFEFFFAEKEEFRQELLAELRLIEPDESRWEKFETIGADMKATGPLVAQRALRSFFEAYAVVAEFLVSTGPVAVEAEAAAKACLGLGKQFKLQRRVTSSEAVSTHLFRNGLALATNRGLLAAGPDVVAKRMEFAAELDDVLTRLEEVNSVELAHIAQMRGTIR
ncbi:MAG TPA: glycerol-3-phosphate 1-O-acyltransferase [Sporichthyaceae bacterium]|jgi:glycerol-3-phosphate O-acyltransferase